MDIPGSSLGVPSDTVPHAVRRIPCTTRDPPLVFRPPCYLEDPLDIPGSSLGVPLDIPGSSFGVPSDTGPHAVWRIPWRSRNPPLVSLQTRAPCCPEDPLDIQGSSLHVPFRHRPPSCLEDPRIQALHSLQFKESGLHVPVRLACVDVRVSDYHYNCETDGKCTILQCKCMIYDLDPTHSSVHLNTYLQ